jgi:hypothetical protein
LIETKTEIAKEKRMAASSQNEHLELDLEHKRMELLEKQAKLLKELTGTVPQTIIDSIVKIGANAAALSAVVHSQLSLDRPNKRRLEEVDALQTSAFAKRGETIIHLRRHQLVRWRKQAVVLSSSPHQRSSTNKVPLFTSI